MARLAHALSGKGTPEPNSCGAKLLEARLREQLETQPLRGDARDLFEPASRMPGNRDQRHETLRAVADPPIETLLGCLQGHALLDGHTAAQPGVQAEQDARIQQVRSQRAPEERNPGGIAGNQPANVCGYMLLAASQAKFVIRKNWMLPATAAEPIYSGFSVSRSREPIHTLISRLA